MRQAHTLAITGIGCLFPGAKTPREFWENLVQNRTGVSMATHADLGRDLGDYFDPMVGTPDKICYQKHGFIRGFQFDSQGYLLPPEEIDSLDRLFQFALHAARAALDDGAPERGPAFNKSCGLIVGNLSSPTYDSRLLFSSLYEKSVEDMLQKVFPASRLKLGRSDVAKPRSPYNIFSSSLPPAFAARALGLGGPSYSIDAACASAIYCLKMAAHHLAAQRCRSMLVGCLCAPDHLLLSHGFNVIQATPPADGHSIPFDQRSQGVALGYGAGFLLVKSYASAIEDQDHIYALVENIGLSNDGGAQHILAPDMGGQILALERAYTGISRDVDYIECHATGTPLGDRIELNSLEAFFKDQSRSIPVGANKGSVGHLLTASGMVSLLKVILSMKNGVIPATVGVTQPLSSTHGGFGGGNMVLQNAPWRQKGVLKRAGINAFGFGGTNAHVVLSEPPSRARQPRTNSAFAQASSPQLQDQADLPGNDRLSIVGMSLRFGDVSTLADFAHTIYTGRQRLKTLSATRWGGTEELLASRQTPPFPPVAAYLDGMEVDCLKLKIPPNILSVLMFPHLCLATLADEACQDAGGLENIGHPDRIGVIVGVETDLTAHRSIFRCDVGWKLDEALQAAGMSLEPAQKEELQKIVRDCIYPQPFFEGITGGIGNIAAARISSILKLRGPSFTLAAQENSVFKAIELAQFFLATQELDAVIVGAIDIAGSVDAVLAREWFPDGRNSIPIGEGGGVIVLKRADTARQDKNRKYADIASMAIAQGQGAASMQAVYEEQKVFDVAVQARGRARIEPEAVDYIEVHAGGLAQGDNAEKRGLAKAYYRYAERKGPAIGSVKANIGHTFVASGMASIIKAALCLHHDFLPVFTPSPAAYPDHLGAWEGTPFTMPARSAPWRTPASATPKMAAINSLSIDGSYAHLILSQADRQPVTSETDFSEESLSHRTSVNDPASAPGKKPPRKLPQFMLNGASNAMKAFSRLDWRMDKGNSPPCDEGCIWSHEQILEMAQGKLSNVLGPDFAGADACPIRARTPSPPFLFVDKVTKLTARQGVLEPCRIEWEYTVPQGAWYLNEGHVPDVILIESSHALIPALSFMGCDALFKGASRYRAVDSQTQWFDGEVKEGEKFVGEVVFHNFVVLNNRLLITYEYNGYCNGRQLFNIHAHSGMFPESDLRNSRGLPAQHRVKHDGPPATDFVPIVACAKRSFSRAELAHLRDGDVTACFGSSHAALDRPFRLHGLPDTLHRIVDIDAAGGTGLGTVTGEVDIAPDHWAFSAHFKNDPVFPGTLLIDGASQVLSFFAAYAGLHALSKGARARGQSHAKSFAKFRGEIKPIHTTVQYRVTVREIARLPGVRVLADVEFIHQGVVIGVCHSLGIVM